MTEDRILTDVEHVPLGTLQFSTSVEGRVLIGGWSVGLLVSSSSWLRPFQDNRSKDFANFWSGVRGE